MPRFDFTTAVRDEIQLEIGIRNRLKQVIEGRLRWARAIRDALGNELKEEEEEAPVTQADSECHMLLMLREHCRIACSSAVFPDGRERCTCNH